MQIQDLEYSELIRHSVQGGIAVNKVTIIALAKSLSSSRALSYFGDAGARAISRNDINISFD
ncbi:MAG: hypothetical protein MUC48_09910 [Leptolyngbya sp. Prado105]|nr:hypothetical protein [Leptolyngbya sp. Prado105]